MELNLKENLFSINDSVYESCQEVAVDCEVNMPEYCTDIGKIMKCMVAPEITSKVISGNRVTIDGIVRINLLYCDTSNVVKSYKTTTPFTKVFDFGKEISNATIKAETSNEYSSTRPLSSRKADIHSSFKLCIEVLENKEIKIISDTEGGGVETEKSEFVAESHVKSGEKMIMLDEEMEIGQSKPPVMGILRFSGSVKLIDTKLITNKMIIKGEATVRVLYSTDNEEMKLEEVEETFPISQILDMEGIDEECLATAELTLDSLMVKERTDSMGDCRNLSVELMIGARADCRKSMLLPIVTDAYSTEYEMELSKERHAFTLVGDRIDDTSTYKKSLELPVTDIGTIESLWCTAQKNVVSCKDGFVTIMGVISVSVLGTDEEGKPFFAERPIDFEYKYKAENSGEDMNCKANIKAKNAGYTLKGGNAIEVRCELEVFGEIKTGFTKNVITNINLNTEQKRENTMCALTVYFAHKGENIWEIAKRYNTAKKSIMIDNKLQDDILDKEQMLLISSK